MILNKIRKYLNLKRLSKELYSGKHQLSSYNSRKAIFVHIPKCAGVSVNQAIFGNLGGAHTTLAEYKIIFNKKDFDDYFKFTIVRNPWDRLASAYHFLKKGGMNWADKKWAEENLNEFNNFNTFVKKWLDEDNIWKYHHFRPQYHYITLKDGTIDIDFIGFLENIDEDYKYLQKRLRIKNDLMVTNKSRKRDYKSYYTNETKNIVSKVYKKDIDLLKYSFDNDSLSQQLKRRSEDILIDSA